MHTSMDQFSAMIDRTIFMLTKIFPLTTSLPASTRKHVIPYIIAGIIGLTAAHGSAVSPAQAAEDPAPGTAEQSIRLEEDETQASREELSWDTETIQSLKQRYPGDRTGVRARLCTCRRDMHGWKKTGHRHRYHGGRR